MYVNQTTDVSVCKQYCFAITNIKYLFLSIRIFINWHEKSCVQQTQVLLTNTHRSLYACKICRFSASVLSLQFIALFLI